LGWRIPDSNFCLAGPRPKFAVILGCCAGNVLVGKGHLQGRTHGKVPEKDEKLQT